MQPRTVEAHKWIDPLSSAFDQKFNQSPSPTKVAYTLVRQITILLRSGNSTVFPKGAHMIFENDSIVTIRHGQGHAISSYLDLDEIIGIDLP